MEEIKNNHDTRPTETELRPIAMTDVSYKILMSLRNNGTNTKRIKDRQ